MLGFIPPVAPLLVGVFDLVEIAAGIIFFLVVAAGWSIYSPLFDVLNGISILGIKPFGFLSSLLADSMKKLWSVGAHYVEPWAHLLWSWVMTIWRPLYVIVSTLQFLAGQITGVSQGSQAGLAQLKAQEQTDVQNLINNLHRDVAILQAQEVADVSRLSAQEHADIVNLINNLHADVATLQDKETGDITNVINNLHADVATLQNQITQSSAALTQRLAGDVSTINATINRDVNSLTQADANTLRTAENFATGLVSGLGIGGLTQTVTALQSQVGKIATETAECLDPLCDTVTPNANELGNLGNLLKALEGLFGVAALTGLLVAAVEDPKGTADAIVDTAGWMETLADDQVNLIGRLAGVQL